MAEGGPEMPTAIWDFIRSMAFGGTRERTDAMAMRMFSRGVIVGLFIGLYIGWMNWAF